MEEVTGVDNVLKLQSQTSLDQGIDNLVFSSQMSVDSSASRRPSIFPPTYKKGSRSPSLARGMDVLAAQVVMQRFNEKAKTSLAKFKSVSYVPSHSAVYIEWLRRQGKSRTGWEFDRWILLLLVGALTGLIAAFLTNCMQALTKVRWDGAKSAAHDDDITLSFGVCCGIAIAYVCASSLVVVFLHPAAAGGGTPEVIAYLNGVIVRGVFSLRNLVVRFVSLVFSNSSGLPVGTHSNVVVFGAIIGMGLGQFQSKVMHCSPKLFTRFRNADDRRAFTTAGVAAGVAAAFNAPIGGLMYAMEDFSTHWTKRLSWQVFFTAIVAQAMASLFKTAFSGFVYQGSFGLFTLSVVQPLQIDVAVVVPAIVLGIIGGILGVLFTLANVHIVGRIRREIYPRIKYSLLQKVAKILECVCLVVIMAAWDVYLPRAFGCTDVRLQGNRTDTRYQQNCYWASMNYSLPFNLEVYNCKNGTYSEVATIMQNGGATMTTIMWSRGTQYLFSYQVCLACAAFWLATSCWACGLTLSAGIFIPMLVGGSLYGRALGMGMLAIWKDETGTYFPSDSQLWAWIDPGLIAALGSGSLLAGTTRLALASSIIVVEMAQDINLMIPMLIAAFSAKQVADLLCKPLWKYQFQAKTLPYLDQEPQVAVKGFRVNLELFKARDVMNTLTKTVRVTESVMELSKLLIRTQHDGFPVIKKDAESGTDVMYGMITRTELYVLLDSPEVFKETRPGSVVEPDVAYGQLSVDFLTDTSRIEERVRHYAVHDTYQRIYINLDPYLNASAPKVDVDYSLQRTYMLFRTLGLRHLTIIDALNRVVGMITRKDLMAFNIEEKLSTLPEDLTSFPEHVSTSSQGSIDTVSKDKTVITEDAPEKEAEFSEQYL